MGINLKDGAFDISTLSKEPLCDCKKHFCNDWEYGDKDIPCPKGLTRMYSEEACPLMKKEIKRLIESSNLPERFIGEIQNIHVLLEPHSYKLPEVLSYFQELRKNLIEGKGLVIYGRSGKIKTKILVLLGVEALHYGSMRYETYLQFATKIEGLTKQSRESYLSLMESVDILCLDGLQNYKVGAWNQMYLWRVLESRYNSKKSTVITTSMSGKELSNLLKQEDIRTKMRENMVTVRIRQEEENV